MKYIALLRGINVGGKNKVSMNDLKNCFENAGFGGARFPKVLDKEYLGSNIVKFRVGFYDDSYKQLQYEKLYTIEENQSDPKEYKLIAVNNIAK